MIGLIGFIPLETPHAGARRVAWFILVALGAIDSGSNPGGPINVLFICRGNTYQILTIGISIPPALRTIRIKLKILNRFLFPYDGRFAVIMIPIFSHNKAAGREKTSVFSTLFFSKIS